MLGYPALREKLAKNFSPIFGRDLDMNKEILVTNGASAANFSIIQNLAGPGDEVLFFEPFFSMYTNQVEFSGASIATAPMRVNEKGEWDFDWEIFESKINEKTKLVVITNPHNPTGKLFSAKDFGILTDILNRNPQVSVLSDDVYWFLPFDSKEYINFAKFSAENWHRTVTVFSCGKMMNATGWKIGWMIGPEDLVKQAMFVHECMTFNTNVPGQIALS